MNDYEILLDLIEKATSGEIIYTDEIDARFNCLFRQWTFLHVKQSRKDSVMFECIDQTGQAVRFGGRFSQSRTDLKDIRPEGCTVEISPSMSALRETGDDRYTCRLWNGCVSNQPTTPDIITEELAEMHAIVQFWAFERGVI